MGCWLFHDWSEWKEVERGEVRSRSIFGANTGWHVTGTYLLQDRRCNRCGKQQLDRQTVNIS